MLAGASCVLITPYAAMAASASPLVEARPTPTVVTMSALIGVQMDDNSVQFAFVNDSGFKNITYNTDGTIINSLLSA